MWKILLTALLLILSGCATGERAVESVAPVESPPSTAFVPTEMTTVTPAPTEAAVPPEPTSTPAPVITAVTGAAGEVIFLDETIPDGTQFAPGEHFRKTWTLRNNGLQIWTEEWALVLIASSTAGETLGGPQKLTLLAEVIPGETLEIGVDLVAPEQDGQYRVTWQLQNTNGELIFGSEVWVSIRVGDAPANSGPIAAGGVQADLTGASLQAGETVVDFCMQMPDTRAWAPGPWDVILIAGQTQVTPSGARIDPGTAQNAYKCWSYSFPTSLASGTAFQLIIGKVEMDATVNLAENCRRAQQTLIPIHPGLNFDCGDYRGFFYANLVLSSGMTKEQADRLILDVMSSAIHGPWVLSGVMP